MVVKGYKSLGGLGNCFCSEIVIDQRPAIKVHRCKFLTALTRQHLVLDIMSRIDLKSHRTIRKANAPQLLHAMVPARANKLCV